MNNKSKGNILIVDDEPNAIKVLSVILSESGYSVYGCLDFDNAADIIHRENIETVITDLKMPGKDGMQLFEFITDQNPDIPVIFLTAYGTVDSAVFAMTQGAYYYFIKPPDYPRLKCILEKAVEQHRLKKELNYLQKRFLGTQMERIIGNNPQMLKILKTIEAIKDSASNVLISGETGTGKELIARALHYDSTRKEKPFIAVNCAAIPRDLLEAELFGFEKGAFTGAISRRIGRFEQAYDGTIFLDEIGEMEPSLQAKILRVLEEREIERLGDNKKVKVEFRLVSSSNRDLKEEVKAGNFREDLFYRINVVQIELPPLSERKDDIPLLVSEFINEFCRREKKVLSIQDKVMGVLQCYQWPGNVRQLRNVLERAVVFSHGDKITMNELPDEFKLFNKKTQTYNSNRTLKEIEIQAVKNTLLQSNGNKSKAAMILGISRKAFYKRLKDYQIKISRQSTIKN
jgi:DNA-binding NtrC family response regulator